jgi:hypothetical protein
MPNGYKGNHKITIDMWDTSKEKVKHIKVVSLKERSFLQEKNKIIGKTFVGHFPLAPDTIAEQAFVMGGIALALQFKLRNLSSKQSIVELNDLTVVCWSQAISHNCVVPTMPQKLIVQYGQLLKANWE